MPDFGTEEDSVAARLAFDSRGWVIPRRDVFRRLRLHTDVLLAGSLALSIDGDEDVIALWENDSDPAPLLEPGGTVVNGVSVVNGRVAGFAAKGGTTELLLKALKPGTAEIRYTFTGTDAAAGVSHTDTLRVTVAGVTLKPVTTELLHPNQWGSLLNPSGFGAGSFGGYAVEVEPAHLFPGGDIKWEIADGADKVSFLYGEDTGRRVALNGDAPGKFRLEVNIGREGDPILPKPSINGQVFAPQPVPLTVWIVTNETTNVSAEVDRVNGFIEGANKAVKQLAQTLFVQGSINFTNNPNWYTLDGNNWSNVVDLTSLSTSTSPNTLKIFFVNQIINGPSAFYKETGGQIVISAHPNNNARSFTHEFLHACGLEDIYDMESNNDPNRQGLSVFNVPLQAEHLPLDWGGGYYPSGMTLDELICGDLLMYGFNTTTDTIDIPAGSVYGITRDYELSPDGPYVEGFVKVGLDGMTTRKPISQ